MINKNNECLRSPQKIANAFSEYYESQTRIVNLTQAKETHLYNIKSPCKSKMSHTHCAVQGCKNTGYNKPVGVSFYACPTNSELRNKWLQLLKNRCTVLDWTRSRICSRHFENKYFDAQRKLKENAIPTLFPVISSNKVTEVSISKTKVDRLLNKLTQAELTADIKSSLSKMKEPANLENYINDDFKCRSDTPVEAQLWILVKKQDHLNTRILEQVAQNKKHVEVLQKNMEETKASKKEIEQSVETYKYIVKCLQEKLATLEEQIEILTTVESR
ncbi:unnamed protein product [Parnassius apollo]|uniref:(apollo) hypothetical protein n=1 Tax=Parnassius apollo TaxID=110799 RepID=A0A8S3WFJ0_PARAO|nr:unnamed protein product [Parnassius apollo]